MNKGSIAKQKFDAAYAARPDQKKKRAQRNAARREYEKAHGDLPSTVDVDHKRRIAKGGTNAPENLRAVPEKKNVGWRKNKKNYG
jgi:hypothetical protein